MFWGIEAKYYAQFFYYVTWLFCLLLCFGYMQSDNNKKLLTPNSSIPTFVLAIILTLFIGLRPDKWWWFGDSFMYAHHYNNVAQAIDHFTIAYKEEWFFDGLESICKYMNFDVSIFFLIIAFFYIFLLFISCQLLLWENTWMALLFCLSSFSFYQFGVNGIRTGMATSLLLLAYAMMTKRRLLYLCIAVGIMVLAFGTHRSMMLPIAMSLIAYFVVKNPMHAIYIWVGCIALSLVAGSSIQNQIIGIVGADDGRMSSYAVNRFNDEFSHTGFRWDFLLYSSVPVLLTYYMVAKRGIQDKTYNFLATTYILANSFWVLVIRMAFTNRFAFLSWFMYPLVIAYALIRVHIWDNQDKKAAYFLLGSTAFSCIMFLLGKI